MTNRTAQKKKSQTQAKAKPKAKGSGARRRQPQRRRPGFAAFAIGAVVLVVLGMVGFSLYNHVKTPSTPGTSASARVVREVTSVPAAALDSVGAGSGVSAPGALPAGTPPIESGGKPLVLYVGAEYCPYCAAERWAMVVALSRFGSFSGLGLTTSSSTDIFPSTRTLTFHGSSYTSDLIAFEGVETQSNKLSATGSYEALETPTATQQQLFSTYNPNGGIPFTLIGNRYVISGASFRPEVLQGKSWQEISAALSDPASPIAKQVLGAANTITAAICTLTNGQPTDVCTSPGVTAAASALPAS